jgi:hypothetical protein
MTPTPEQEAIIAAARDTQDNLIIRALAGAAKTSTLVLIDKALPSTPKLALCFNVRIKEEMAGRLSGVTEAKTLNSLGHNVWGKSIGRRLIVNKEKVRTLVKSHIDGMPYAQRGEAYENFSDMTRLISHGKLSGYVPTGVAKQVARPLKDDDTFFDSLDENLFDWQYDMIRAVSTKSINMAQQGEVDFDDQIFMPTCFQGQFPSYPLVLVDEAQDLSALNHAMLKKLVRKRVIAVGDECQAIYGFRGAHQNSMDLLRSTFSMRPLTLSISFRCPQSVVREARARAPMMQWPEWAKEGRVRRLGEWSVDDLPNECTVLCRNNAPLFSMAIAFLKAGRYPELVGNDIGKGLLKILEKMGKPSLPKENLLMAIDNWMEERQKRAKDDEGKDKIRDQAECLRVFADQGSSLGDAIAYAKHLLASAGPVKMMTGHKAKGLEWDDVFILDEHLIKPFGQDVNLRYVMQTRAKENLTYVYSEHFIGAGLPNQADEGGDEVGQAAGDGAAGEGAGLREVPARV